MSRSRSRYEVQVYKVDHWVLDTVFEEEAQARAYGKSLLASAKAEGYRIVRDWQRPDGRHVETEVFQDFRASSTAIVISPVEEAPVCDSLDQYYKVEARITVNRLLRGYVERFVVTPTEVMHNYAELKRLVDRDNLLASAVGRVAALQAEKCRLDGRTRRDEMFGVVDRITERARAASTRTDLPAIARTGFRPAYEKLVRLVRPEDVDFHAKVVLSRDLVQMRNWFAKLDFLGELVHEDGGLTEAPLRLVDGVLGDVLGAPSVMQELLGIQRSLADALCSLLDLALGRLLPADRPEEERLLHLNELLAFNDLDETRHVIFELVRRQLKGSQPLYRADPMAEREAFNQVLTRMVTPNGIVGGGPLAEALVYRYGRFLEAGGASGRRQAIGEVVSRLPDSKDRVRFLIALTDSEMGRQHREDVSGLLESLTGDPGLFSRFVDRDRPIKDNLEDLTRLYLQVSASPLSNALRTRLADNIDGLLVGYIVSSRVVERLDNPEDLLRHRANRLIQLCTPGVLQSTRALDMVRRRVVAHLRQPNFETRYVEDIPDPALRQQALRDFYKLLGSAGLT